MKAKVTQAQESEYPPVPDCFVPSDFRHDNSAWARGMAVLHAENADHSGPDKHYREARKIGWIVFLRGGNVRATKTRYEQFSHQRAKALSKIASLERAGRDTSAARREVEAAERNLAALEPLIQAAESYSSPDNVELRDRYEAAAGKPEAIAANIERYKRAGFTVPDGEERLLYEAQRTAVSSQRQWEEARAHFDKIGAQLGRAVQAAFTAHNSALAHVLDRLGESAAKLITENDPDFLTAYPANAPDELVAIHARAQKVAGIMSELGDGSGMARFYWSCGEVAEPIVMAKLEAGRFVQTERNMTATASTGSIMGTSF